MPTIQNAIAAILLFATCAVPARGAPHFKGLPEPPAAKVGQHLAQRMAIRSRAVTLSGATVVNVLLLRVDFPLETPDDPNTTGDGTWGSCAGACNGDPDYWVSRIASDFPLYYDEVSGGRFAVNVAVSPAVYRLPFAMASYGTETAGAIENLIYDAVTAADADLDFSAYDAVMIVHAGAGQETDANGDTPSDIWSLYYSDNFISRNDSDGEPPAGITEAILVPQSASQDGLLVDVLGIYAHEFGHWLGLPDLYATGWFRWDGIGDWGLMGSGFYNRATADDPYGSSPAHPGAWSKAFLNWVTVTELSAAPPDPGIYQISPVGDGGTVIKLPVGADGPNPYFLLENRRPIGFDTGLPGAGLLVWMIDEAVVTSGLATNTVNASPYRPGVALLEADGDQALKTIEAGCGGSSSPPCDIGSAGDPFPGSANNTLLTPQTTPGSALPQAGGWVNLKNIAEDGAGNVSLVIGFAPAPATDVRATQECNGEYAVTWSPSPTPDVQGYQVFKNGTLTGEVSASSFSAGLASSSDVFSVATTDMIDNLGAPTLAAWGKAGCSGSSDRRCFIATAAHGSGDAASVRVLRGFRDRYLMKHPLGRRFVAAYYAISPPIAEAISGSDALKLFVRLLLLPVVGLAWLILQLGPWGGGLALVGGGLLLSRLRRTGRRMARSGT